MATNGWASLGELLSGQTGRDAREQGALAGLQATQTSAKTQEALAKAKLATLGADAGTRLSSRPAEDWTTNPDALIGDIVAAGFGSDFSGAMQGRNYGQTHDLRATVADPATDWATMQRALAAIDGKPVNPITAVGAGGYANIMDERPDVLNTPLGDAMITDELASAAAHSASAKKTDAERLNPTSRTSAPSGYRFRADGSLEAIPGGPSDNSGPAARKNSQPLRKEFRSLQSVKDLETSLPLYESAKKAPDTGAGDLQLIYTVGKILDPGSVVREGELKLTIDAGSPLQKILGATRFNFEQGGRITPEVRQQMLAMLQERVGAYEQAYDRDYQQFSQYAQESGLDPSMVVGSRASSAYNKPKPPAGASSGTPASQQPVKVSTPAEAMALPSGTRFITPDGRVKVRP